MTSVIGLTARLRAALRRQAGPDSMLEDPRDFSVVLGDRSISSPAEPVSIRRRAGSSCAADSSPSRSSSGCRC